MHPASKAPPKAVRFSIVAGGALFRLWRRVHLRGHVFELMKRRVIVIALAAWAPLLLLSALEGSVWPGDVALPFAWDIEIHAKLLVALPLLILAEAKVHERLQRIVGMFLESRLIIGAARQQFDEAIASAARLRDSVLMEALLLLFVYVVGIGVIWYHEFALDVTSWYFFASQSGPQLSYAGWWAVGFSLPVFQFILLRWYLRLFIWARFLWQVSRMDLQLKALHPDGAGGLRFLSMTARAFSVVMLAQGAALSAMIANRIFHGGAKLLEFKVELVGTVALMIFAILVPLLFFHPQLRKTRHEGIYTLGKLGQRYATEFERKWIRADEQPGDAWLGNADIQSLADLRVSYVAAAHMRLTPFGLESVIQLAVMTLLPVAPLLLTTFSVEQMLERMLKVLF